MEKNNIAQPKLPKHEAVDRLLTHLPAMDPKALRKLWHDLFGRRPSPALYRATLIPILAYRIQERAYGGLKESTRKRLRELAMNHANGKKSVVQAIIRPKSGTRYVREYGGKLHEVTVLEAGYEYQGQVHRSLTEVAKVITGTKWSGPVFFGYPGQHQAILDREIWDKVQALLAANRQGGKRKPRATKNSLFTGLLFDSGGTRYTPTHATKNGRRYRYYTSQAVIKKSEKVETPTRIPAHDLESAVIERFLNLLRDPRDLVASIRDDFQEGVSLPGDFLTRIVGRATSAAATWQSLPTPDKEHFLRAVIDRVIIHPTRVEIRIRVPQFIQQLLGNNSASNGTTTVPPQTHLQLVASIECPFRHISQGRALRLIVGNTNITPEASRQAILKAIARARLWYEQLTTGEASSISQLADRHGLSERFLHAQMKLVQLSPKSIENLMNGTGSLPLSIADLLTAIPMNWREQAFNLATSPLN